MLMSLYTYDVTCICRCMRVHVQVMTEENSGADRDANLVMMYKLNANTPLKYESNILNGAQFSWHIGGPLIDVYFRVCPP